MIRDIIRYTPPKTWGVICIDCWDQGGINDLFYETALHELSKYNIGAVVNCATDLLLTYDDISVYNTLKQYLWAADTINVKVNDNVLLDLVRGAGKQKSSQVLQQGLFDENTIYLNRRETFQHHGHYYWPEIQDWIILGSAWQVCIHRGPMGVDTLVDIPNHKFHIFPDWSVQTEAGTAPTKQQIHDDFFVWAPIENNGYRLITRANNSKWTETT